MRAGGTAERDWLGPPWHPRRTTGTQGARCLWRAMQEGSGMDFMKMAAQARKLQARMAELQEEIGSIEVTGSSGGGLVTVTMTGKGAVKNVKIDPSLMKPEETEILEDLIVAAHADARGKAERAMQEKTQALMGEIGLPPGMKLPF